MFVYYHKSIEIVSPWYVVLDVQYRLLSPSFIFIEILNIIDVIFSFTLFIFLNGARVSLIQSEHVILCDFPFSYLLFITTRHMYFYNGQVQIVHFAYKEQTLQNDNISQIHRLKMNLFLFFVENELGKYNQN